ncbi:hypothetical protein KY290_027961 [Solanum tuberosum]|uniref:Retrovirus-related Pol polyprotein from transposon TNT 1-94-like beta-barrel domain-containing protein n=1 Tax=Solanum tuberosum TaxID=4113 RepID=A0ABQ7UH02_SOLTU|nr:hypothetical protein KY290_027961 [Solanum tuberosum]
MGLNEKFNVVRSQILNTEPLPSLARVYGLVSQEERQQQLTTSKGNNLLEGASFASKRNTNTFNSRQLSGNRDVSKLFCDHCKRWRHTKDKCFELHGYPDWWENNRKGKGKSANSSRTSEVERVDYSPISGLSKEQYNQLMSLLSLENSKGIDSMANFAGKAVTFPAANYEWILDSGASDHMTCQKNSLSNERKLLFDSNITIPDGSSVTANTCGNVTLNSSITLNHVLHVPMFGCNLISIRLSHEEADWHG